jgi:hypothetical protein
VTAILSLRLHEDQRNREFFENITHNVHVNVEDHLSKDVVKRVPRFNTFPHHPQPKKLLQPPQNPAENETKAKSNSIVIALHQLQVPNFTAHSAISLEIIIKFSFRTNLILSHLIDSTDSFLMFYLYSMSVLSP